MMTLGLDPGAKGGIALMDGPRLVFATKTKVKSTAKGTERLLLYGAELRRALSDIKVIVPADKPIQAYFEEPPHVRSIKTYAILMQYLAVAMVTIHQEIGCEPVLLTVPTWKGLIDCPNVLPREIRVKGTTKGEYKKFKETWLKQAIRDSVWSQLDNDSWEVALAAAGGDQISDIFDAVGIALAGRVRYLRSRRIDLEV